MFRNTSRAFKALGIAAIPAVAAGGLLFFGAQGANAAGQTQQFVLGGQTITLQGSGFTSSINSGILRISATDFVQIQVTDKQVIDLGPGDAITLSSVSGGGVISITMIVQNGEAQVIQV